MRSRTQYPGQLSLFCMWTPILYLLLSTAGSVWRQDVLAEEYSLSPGVADFLDELKAMRNCAAPKGKMKVVCAGRNESFLQSPAMMDHWEIFKQNYCYCDGECHLFRDCCADVADMSTSRRPDVIKGIPAELWSCERLLINRTAPEVSQVHIHMVSACPASATPRHKCMPVDSEVRVDSNYLLDMPVMDRDSGVWYLNVFCASCHRVENLAPLNRTVKCDDGTSNDTAIRILANSSSTYRPGELRWVDDAGTTCYLHVRPTRWSDRRPDADQHVPGFYRPCVDVVDTCAQASARSVAAERCPKFAYYVMKDVNTVYKNHYCAQCNGVPLSELRCWKPLDVVSFRVSNRFSAPSLSIVMDFRWDLNWRQGRLISAPAEAMYDAVLNQCVPLAESIYSYTVEGTRCVRVDQDVRPNATDCNEVWLKKGEYKILANGSLLVLHNVKYNEMEFDTEVYRPLGDDVVAVCATKMGGEQLIHSGRAEGVLTWICLSISTICLVLHIITYSSIPKLRNLPGRNLVSLSWALLLAQSIFLFGVHPIFDVPRAFCIVIAVLIQYFYLAAFFWMSVMSYDIWRKFTTPTPESGRVSLHLKYSVFAWTTPAAIVALAVIVDRIAAIPPYVRPNYGLRDTCWFGSPLGQGIFFSCPLIVIMIVNTVLFATTVRKIMAQKRESGNYLRNQVRTELLEAKARQGSTTGRPSAAATRSPTSGARDTVRLYLYVKLFTIMGLTWIFGFVAAFARFQPLWYPFIILNGLQGAFIFVMFDCKRSIGVTMWEKTLGRRVATPGFLRAPGTTGASRTSRSGNSSMSTTRSRLTFNGTRSSKTSSVLSDTQDDANLLRQKARVRMSDIVHEENEHDKSAGSEETTRM